MSDAIVYCDGGGGNGKPHACAAVLYADGELVDERAKALGKSTRSHQVTVNVAEYEALLLGLELAAEHGYTEIDVRMDSKLVVEQVVGGWRVKQDHLRAYQVRAQTAARRFNEVRIKHVPRKQNRRADAVCGEMVRAQMEGFVYVGEIA